MALQGRSASVYIHSTSTASHRLVATYDGGQTFQETTLSDLFVNVLVFDDVVIALGRQLARSTDGGKTFSPVNPDGWDTMYNLCWSGQLIPGSPGTIYASCMYQGTARLLKSSDLGASWDPIGFAPTVPGGVFGEVDRRESHSLRFLE